MRNMHQPPQSTGLQGLTPKLKSAFFCGSPWRVIRPDSYAGDSRCDP